MSFGGRGCDVDSQKSKILEDLFGRHYSQGEISVCSDVVTVWTHSGVGLGVKSGCVLACLNCLSQWRGETRSEIA